MIRDLLVLQALREDAARLGFFLLGVVRAQEAPDFSSLCDWLDRGYAGSMEYLERRRDAYRHPQFVLEGCQSILMLGMPYAKHPRTLKPKVSEPPVQGPDAGSDGLDSARAAGTIQAGTIAAYAMGARDYHEVIRDRHSELLASLNRMFPGAKSRGIVDTAPFLERCFARLAGLGWQGKNTLLLNRHLGSNFFLSAILTDARLPDGGEVEVDHCGTCTACLDACPTQAFPSARVLDATRCISYWTIEHRGVIPESMRAGVSDWLFGCDVCQMVCPWNRKPSPAVDPELSPESCDDKSDCLFWLELDEEGFRKRFRRTPFWRSGLRGMQRNAMIVAANTGRRDAVEAIERLQELGDPTLEETARWSLNVLAFPS